jgi:hypothetical protein
MRVQLGLQFHDGTLRGSTLSFDEIGHYDFYRPTEKRVALLTKKLTLAGI